MREDLRRYLGNTETGKCRKSLQYWAFEKKYKAKTELYEYDKSSIHLPRQYLPQPYGGICDEGLSGKGGDFRTV